MPTKQAVILAGGFGTRLGELTQKTPKSMIPIHGVPFLEILVSLLKKQGITDFIFCVGHLSSQIQSHFQDGSKMGCRIRYSIENPPLGTGGALKKALALLDKTFLLLNGDNYLEIDYLKLIHTFELNPQWAGMVTCWENNPPKFRSNVRLAGDGLQIADYHYSDSSNKTHVDCGVKIFSEKLFPFFESKESFSLEIDCMHRLAEQSLLGAYPVSSPPLDIGSLQALESAQKALKTIVAGHEQ